MKMKLIYGLVSAAICFTATSCKEYRMDYYDQPHAVNFIGTDNKGRDSDDPSTLNATLNFATKIPTTNDEGIDTIVVKLRLQGYLNPAPLRVSIYAEKTESFPLAVVNPMNPYAFPDSTHQMNIKVPVQCPPEKLKEYRAILKFDYANSDAIAGFNTLQSFTVTLIDDFSKVWIKGMDKWSEFYQPLFGPQSETKSRFLIRYAETYDFDKYFGLGGPTEEEAEKVREALREYNEANPDKPLLDDDGNPISFDPE